MKKRLFLAIELPEHIKNEIIIRQNNLVKKLGIKGKTRRDSLHMTIKFIGDFEENLIKGFCEELANQTKSAYSFTLTLKKLGCFPNCRNPRIVFVSTDRPKELIEIVNISESVSELFNIPKETREFTPHITIYRPKRKAIIEETKVNPLSFEVESITLFQSILKPEGAKYIALKKFPLG